MVHEAESIYHLAHYRKSSLSFAFSGTISRKVVKGANWAMLGVGGVPNCSEVHLWLPHKWDMPSWCFLGLVSLTLRRGDSIKSMEFSF